MTLLLVILKRQRCLPWKNGCGFLLMMIFPVCHCLVVMMTVDSSDPGPGPAPVSLCPPGSGLPPLLSSHSAGRDNLWSRSPPGRPRHLPPVSRGRETRNVPGSCGAEGGRGTGGTRSRPSSQGEPRVTPSLVRTRKLN